MRKLRVAINGLGRIGRTILRETYNREIQEFDIVAVNNPGKPEEYLHLLKYDSLHGRFKGSLSYTDNALHVNGDQIHFFHHKDPAEIPWDAHQVDIVIDATGIFRTKESLSKHLRGSVKRVILCAPGKGVDTTLVMGINHESYNPALHQIISNASCTTNCLAPVAKVLHNTWGIKSGLMTTIHSYTLDQGLLDSSHHDPRRARAAALSMIPTTTGAAKAVGLVIPDLKGKLDGYAVRVPTPNVSIVDLNVTLSKEASIEEINQAMKKASETDLKGILAYTDEELVGQDFMGQRESSIFDSKLTNVIGNTAKVVAWYDNETGFSNRIIDLAIYLGEQK